MSGILHFFPGTKKMIWVINGNAIVKVEAWGGEEPLPNVDYDLMKPRKTTPGYYVIYSVAPYKTKTWPYSRLAWGTPIRLGLENEVLYSTGRTRQPWAKLTKLIPTITRKNVQEDYYALYGKKQFPDRWVFNEFGVKAIRYYRDKNKNRKLDEGEILSGEMIHTTPDNEAETALGKQVQLAPSHGCIHLKPRDRDQLEKAGAFARGNTLLIHRYEESIPTSF